MLKNVNKICEISLFQAISLESTIRMRWFDTRITLTNTSDLAYKTSEGRYLLFNRDPVRELWFPDVFIPRAKDVRVPAYKILPSYLRIYDSGLMMYSARVNYDLSCPMNFKGDKISKATWIFIPLKTKTKSLSTNFYYAHRRRTCDGHVPNSLMQISYLGYTYIRPENNFCCKKNNQIHFPMDKRIHNTKLVLILPPKIPQMLQNLSAQFVCLLWPAK